MRKGVLFALAVSILFVFILAVAPSGFAQVVTLKYSNFFPAPHKHSLLAEQWGIEVEKRTNGRVKVIYYPAATLTPATQTYDSVVKGIADIGMSCQAYTRGKFPLSEVIDLPLSYRSGLVATRMTNEFLKKFQPKEYDETQVMFLHAHGPGILHTKKPVTKLEEMKGLKVRSTGLSAKIVQALGGAPVGMPMNEAYDALAKGVADGILGPNEALKGYKLGEVTAFTTENYGSTYSTAFFVVMNKAKWNSLPKDAQAIIEKLNDEWVEKTGKLWDEIDLEGKDYAIQKGMKFLPLSKEEDARWAKAVRPILDEYAQNAKAKGLPGDQALKFCQDYLAAHQ
jgi:TRAP-type C4-dicarboxylate transport system substrate-binding protein